MRVNEFKVSLPQKLTVNSLCKVDFELFWRIKSNPVCKIIFDFSRTDFVRPAGLASIVAFMKFSKHLEIAGEYYLREPRDENVKQYLKRMGFYEQFGIIREPVNPKKETLSTLCELREVKDESEAHEMTGQLIRIIKEQVQPGEKMMQAISYALGEIVDNVFHHSKSPVNGFVCAQTYAGKGVEIAVADCGIGIKESLKGNPIYKEVRSDESAIKLALGKMVTGKPGTNSGQGLFVCQRYIKENMGQMDIVSGSARYALRGGNITIKSHPFWQGTIVSLVFTLKHPIDPKKILDSEFPLDADIDELFEKG